MTGTRWLWAALLVGTSVLSSGCNLFSSRDLSESQQERSTTEWDKSGDLDDWRMPIGSIAYSSNGKRLVTATRDVRSLLTCPDCKSLRTFPPPRRITIWELSDWQTGPSISNDRHNIALDCDDCQCSQVRFTPDGNTVVTTTLEGFHLFDAKSGGLLKHLKTPGLDAQPDSPLKHDSLDNNDNFYPRGGISADAKQVVWSRADGSLVLRELETGRERVLNLSRTDVRRVLFSPNGEHLAVSFEVNPLGDDRPKKPGTIFIVDTKQMELVSVCHPKGPDNRYMWFSSDGRFLATGDRWQKGEVSIFETTHGKLLRSLKIDGVIWSTAWSPDGRMFVCGGEADQGKAGQVTVWETDTWRKTAFWKVPSVWGVTALAFSPDGTTLAEGHSDGTVTFRQVARNE